MVVLEAGLANPQLKIGAEITIDYVREVNFENARARRQHLVDQYGFECMCSICVVET
jgi:hypothetical protein